MKHKRAVVILTLLALAGSFVATRAFASRNSLGTYSLPVGNPVVTGTTITSTWANTTLADIAAALTNSLDRTGKGAMQAALQLFSGTTATPGLNFASETNSGLYRSSAGDIRMAVLATDVQQWTDATSTFGRGLIANQVTTNGAAVTATGHAADGGAILATGGPPNGVGVYSTGSGTAVGGWFNGGTSNGDGIKAVGGATNGFGATIQGTGTGVGAFVNGGGATTTYAQFTSAITGSASAGGLFASNANGSHGVVGWGTGAGSGVYGKAGGSGFGGEFDGNVRFRNANPASTTGFTNTLTPSGVPKAWGSFTSSASPSLGGGLNVASLSCATSQVTVTFGTAMANANYAVVATAATSQRFIYITSKAAGSFRINSATASTGVVDDLCAVGIAIDFIVLGTQ